MSDELVLLVRTMRDGTIIRAWMPPEIAIAEIGYNERNGLEFASARIVADGVNMGYWDRSV